MGGDEYGTVRLAAVQAAPVWLDRDGSVQKACDLIREAGANGADFVGFPENFIPAHPLWYYFYPATSRESTQFAVELFKNSVEIPSPSTDALCDAARDAGVYAVVGLTEKRPDTTGTLYNTQLFIDRNGSIVGKHQKLVPTLGERLVHTGGMGNTVRTFPSPFGPVSGLLCGENSNPLAVAVIASEYTRIHVASWPNHLTPTFTAMGKSSVLRSGNIAFMCKCFVLSACGTVSEEMAEALAVTPEDRKFLRDPEQSGGTVILNPRADVIAGPMGGDTEGILYADADLEETLRGRLLHDVGGHYNRPDVFRLHVNPQDADLVTRDTSGSFEPPFPPDLPTERGESPVSEKGDTQSRTGSWP